MNLPLGLIDLLPVQTARLTLRRLELSDLDPLAAMLADPQVMTYFPRPMTRPEAELWLRRNVERYAQHGTGLFAVTRRDGAAETFVGDCGVQVRPLGGMPHAELGYHFLRDAWGHGYATEAAEACIDLALRGSNASEVVALVRPENHPSQRVVRRLGMQPSGTVLHAGRVHDIWRMRRGATRC